MCIRDSPSRPGLRGSRRCTRPQSRWRPESLSECGLGGHGPPRPRPEPRTCGCRRSRAPPCRRRGGSSPGRPP
eukprot:9271728-Alexandrium_andersonii.AAC.1